MADCAEKAQHLWRWRIKFMIQFASFYSMKWRKLSHKTRLITRSFASIHFAFYYQQWRHLKLTLQRPPQFRRLTTPLSLRRGAGGEALFPSNHPSRSLNQRSILPPLPCMFAMISASLTRFWSPIIVFFNAEADRAKSRQCWSSSGHFSRAWMKAATNASPHPMGSTTGWMS